jgi:hypothetical protein
MAPHTARMTRPRTTRRRILTFALGLPGAYEDHPWDEDVAKVNKKIFVFLGMDDAPEHGMSVKLRESHDQALSVRGVSPTGYGLVVPAGSTYPSATPRLRSTS